MSLVSFRPSSPEDLPLILAAEAQGFADGFIGRDTAETHLAWMGDPDVEHRMVLVENRFVGYLILRGVTSDTIEIKRICLIERGTGIGTAVFASLMPWAFEERGARCLWLDIYIANARARRLYQKAGFREEGRILDEYGGELILMSIPRGRQGRGSVGITQ
jgi:RimJ/RimL family protein N-acetyltransferase